ncbi:hypothetical protein [Paenibacillus dendritiformis]|uniref:hypothetical protein n=1 Tax=Paenibacillus dendritiformis TaxID=130049 RepID=UPI000592B92A|nr:hypothetical protein [Paenibacillus dendritiformis]CAH8772242.1 hypothetical protein H7S4_004981 [Paenibacillus dendritiformis]
MKKKTFLVSSLLTFIMMLVLAVPAFAETSSTSFSLKAGDFRGCCNQYLKVNSNGSVTVSVNDVRGSRYWDIQVIVYNAFSGKELVANFSENDTRSKTFSGLKAGEYNIRIENKSLSHLSGSLGFSWTGDWGRWIE